MIRPNPWMLAELADFIVRIEYSEVGFPSLDGNGEQPTNVYYNRCLPILDRPGSKECKSLGGCDADRP